MRHHSITGLGIRSRFAPACLFLFCSPAGLPGSILSQGVSVSRFRVDMPGSSDLTFPAYNNQSIVISNALPVTLGCFKAKPVENKIELKWNTLTETGASHFIIEKSRGTGYQRMDSIRATGRSTQEKEYTAYDASPSAGTSYYRLKIVNRNGSFQYSAAAEVFYEKTSAFSIYPNPASGPVTMLHSAALPDDRISIYDSAGKLVLSQDILNGRTFTQLNLQKLPRGVYHVSLRSNGVSKGEQLVLQ